MWPFKRKEWEKLGASMTADALRAQLAQLNSDFTDLRDRGYRAISAKDFEEIIFDSWFPNNEPAYRSEVFDCDKFAVCFMANVYLRWAKISKGSEALAFGYIAANVEGMGWHAFIWHVDDQGVIRFYEPQNGHLAAYKFLGVAVVES